MDFLTDLINNEVFMAAILAWAIAQFLKTVYDCYKYKEFNIERLVGSGGMPSSHTELFAIVVVFTLVVMYDATGVRQAAGKHAKAINRIVRQLRVEHTIDDISLKELLGHTQLEVIAGAVLGFVVGCFFVK
jgi:acid phosphatase family membrane protein YuiD